MWLSIPAAGSFRGIGRVTLTLRFWADVSALPAELPFGIVVLHFCRLRVILLCRSGSIMDGVMTLTSLTIASLVGLTFAFLGLTTAFSGELI